MKYYDKKKQCVIDVKTEMIDGKVILTVKDNGIGIDFNKIKKKSIFEPFTRFTKKSSGRGIGLHLIKNIVEKNGGYINVESKIGEGTTFYIHLRDYDKPMYSKEGCLISIV